MKKLTKPRLERIIAHWNAANYLAAGRIHLPANPLLKEPLKPERIKPRLLGRRPWAEADLRALQPADSRRRPDVYHRPRRHASYTGQPLS